MAEILTEVHMSMTEGLSHPTNGLNKFWTNEK